MLRSRRYLCYILILLVMLLLTTAASCPAAVKFEEGVTGLGSTEDDGTDIFFEQAGICSDDTPGELFFPLDVSGLRLTSVVSGENAKSQITEFLGSDFLILNSFVSCYSGRGEEAVFWIIELSGESEAGLLINQMAGRIAGSSFFLDYAILNCDFVDTLHYTRFKGKANSLEHHFFYRKEQFVYWVSMNADDPVSLMEDFIDQF